MKKHISILFALLCFIAANLSAQSYEATYHLISKSYTLNEDGSLDYRYRKELQIFTRASFDTYGETFILYNPEFQTLTINEAYTVRKDGSVVKTPDNAFNPSLPYSCTDCERFNGMREMVVTHTALEYDATIVLEHTESAIRSQARRHILPQASGTQAAFQASPVFCSLPQCALSGKEQVGGLFLRPRQRAGAHLDLHRPAPENRREQSSSR